MKIEETEFYKLLVSKEKYSNYISIIDSTSTNFSEHSSKSTLFNSYTDHSLEHSISIINHMWNLSPKPNDLNGKTIFYLIMSALCHDFGLLISKDDRNLIQSNKYIINQQNYYEWESTKTFISYQNSSLEKEDIQTKALQLIARNLHTNREVIRRKIDIICPNTLSIYDKEDLTLICFAHGATPEDIEQLLHNSKSFHQEFDIHERVDFGFVIALLRLGDILDIGVDRVHNISKEYNDFDEENIKHETINSLISEVWVGYEKTDYQVCGLTMENKTCPRYPKKIILRYNQTVVSEELLGNSLDYLFNYIEWIEEEIMNANKYFLCKYLDSNSYEKKYYYATMLAIFPKVEQVDFPKEFEYRLIGMDKKSIVDLITSENLYPNKESFLRELVQNAIDACMFYCCESDNTSYKPEVKIILGEDTLCIEDNGIGMNSNVLIDYYLKIGSSYYSSKNYIFSKNQFSHAGHFGLGAYSVFLVSSEVLIETKRENSEIIKVEYGKTQNYVKISRNVLESNSSFKRYEHGTKIVLKLKEEFKETFKDINCIKKYMNRTFLKNEKVSLRLIDSSTSFDLGTNLKSLDEWCRNKSLIGQKEINQLDKYFNGIECRIIYEEIETINKYFNQQSNTFVDSCDFEIGQNVVVYSYEYNNKKYNYIILDDSEYVYENEKIRIIEDLCIVDDVKFVDLNIPKNSVINCFKAKIIKRNSEKTIINSSVYSSYSGCSIFSKIDIFLHNIHIKNADFNLGLLPNINIHSCALNIQNPLVIPTITRDDISVEMLLKVREALFYAILNDLGLDASFLLNDINSNPFIRREKS